MHPLPQGYSLPLSHHAPPLEDTPTREYQHWLSRGLCHNYLTSKLVTETRLGLNFRICKLGEHYLALTFSWQVLPFWVSQIQDQFSLSIPKSS